MQRRMLCVCLSLLQHYAAATPPRPLHWQYQPQYLAHLTSFFCFFSPCFHFPRFLVPLRPHHPQIERPEVACTPEGPLQFKRPHNTRPRATYTLRPPLRGG